MAGIRVTPDQFADIVVAFLLDNIMHPKEILPNNAEFDYVTDKMKGSGLKSQLLSYYIDTSSITRGKYRMIRDSFTGQDNSNTIVISGKASEPLPDDEKLTIKNIVKQTLKLIKSHKMRCNNGMPLNESVVNQIIDKVLDNYNKEK